MTDGISKRNNLNTLALFLSLGVIAAAIILRFIHLSADPPYFFAGTGQDLLTDPYNVTLFARNKVLFGSWDIFNYPRWIFFKYSLSSAASYILFYSLSYRRSLSYHGQSFGDRSQPGRSLPFFFGHAQRIQEIRPCYDIASCHEHDNVCVWPFSLS